MIVGVCVVVAVGVLEGDAVIVGVTVGVTVKLAVTLGDGCIGLPGNETTSKPPALLTLTVPFAFQLKLFISLAILSNSGTPTTIVSPVLSMATLCPYLSYSSEPKLLVPTIPQELPFHW